MHSISIVHCIGIVATGISVYMHVIQTVAGAISNVQGVGQPTMENTAGGITLDQAGIMAGPLSTSMSMSTSTIVVADM